MTYEHVYPILQAPEKHVTVRWSEGFRDIEVLFEGTPIYRDLDRFHPLQNIHFRHDYLGRVELRLLKKTSEIDVVISDMHSPANRNYPRKRLKGFWIVPAILLLLMLIRAGMDVYVNSHEIVNTQVTYGLMWFIAIVAYALAAFLLRRLIWWGYYLAIGFIGLQTLVWVIRASGERQPLDFVILGLLLLALVFLALFLKIPFQMAQHEGHEKKHTDLLG